MALPHHLLMRVGGLSWRGGGASRRRRRRRNTEPERCHIHQCDCYEPACHWVHSSLCDVNRGMTHRLQWDEKKEEECIRAAVHARTLCVCVCVCVHNNRLSLFTSVFDVHMHTLTFSPAGCWTMMLLESKNHLSLRPTWLFFFFF